MNKTATICLAVFAAISCSAKTALTSVALISDKQKPEVEFAVQELRKACQAADLKCVAETNGDSGNIKFQLNEALGREAYQIVQKGKEILISGGDENGLMYGGLELSDRIQDGEDPLAIGTLAGKPYMPNRGIKFNIPLDARTPSYDDTGDAAQKNIETMWSFEFWQNYLDNMARYRYNLLTLWSLHPYPSMVKVPGFEDVALDNVCVYTNPITSKTSMKWKGEDIQNPAKLRIVKKMTIDEKIAFWKKVFQYADDRGIAIHMYHWNVFVMGAEGEYGIKWRQDCPETVKYIKESVKQFLLTYPNVKGIGVTAGEEVNGQLKGEYAIENWIWLTYGKAVEEARAINPAIKVTFIFRQHQTDMNSISQAFKDYTGPFETEFKYSRARMFSSTTPPWFDHIYREEVEKSKIKIWMNVRNDDLFNFRWGNPEYAGAYIKNMPVNLMSGYFWAPDGYVYARDFNSKNPEGLPQYEIDKQWYLFMIWGRAGYNPDLPRSFYVNRIKQHFPSVDASKMYDTWKATSDVIEWVDKIHFRQNDAEFLAEGCFDMGTFHSVDSFCRIPCMPEQGLSSIGDFVLNGKVAGELTPFDVAGKLDAASKTLLDGAGQIQFQSNRELEQTTGDLKAMGWLAEYYAHKVRAATCLSLYRHGGDDTNKAAAIHELESGVVAWNHYAQAADANYKPELFSRTQFLDWKAFAQSVEKDVEIAKNAKVGDPVSVSGSNYLWKRDKRSN